jgi:hypothetical protein
VFETCFILTRSNHSERIRARGKGLNIAVHLSTFQLFSFLVCSSFLPAPRLRPYRLYRDQKFIEQGDADCWNTPRASPEEIGIFGGTVVLLVIAFIGLLSFKNHRL